MAALVLSLKEKHPLHFMTIPVIARFAKNCMRAYARSEDIGWNVSQRDDEAEDKTAEIRVEDEYDPVFNKFIVHYIKRNEDIFEDYYEYLSPLIKTQSQFENWVLGDIATSEFQYGYHHAGFFRFIAWAMFLAFRFYEINDKRSFPKAAMYNIADKLDHYLKSPEFVEKGGFIGLTKESVNTMCEKAFCPDKRVVMQRLKL